MAKPAIQATIETATTGPAVFLFVLIFMIWLNETGKLAKLLALMKGTAIAPTPTTTDSSTTSQTPTTQNPFSGTIGNLGTGTKPNG